MQRNIRWKLSAILLSTALGAGLFVRGAAAEALGPQQQLAHDIYKELVEINTVTATGDTRQAAEAMAARLRAAGLPRPTCRSSRPRRARAIWWRGCAAPARASRSCCSRISTSCEAKREDWSIDPFKLIEKDGYFYARGSGDDKYMAAAFVANLIRYKQEGYKPDRDIIVALETDEEILDRRRSGHPVAAQESSRPDRCRVRAERGRRRRFEGRQADPRTACRPARRFR